MNDDFMKAASDIDGLIDQLPGHATLCFNIAPGVNAIISNDGEYRATADWAEMLWAYINDRPMDKWEVI